MVERLTGDLHLILLCVGAIGILLTLIGALKVWKRGGRGTTEAETASLGTALEPFRDEFPALCRVVQGVLDLPGSEALLTRGDVQAAMRFLETRGAAKRKQRPDKKRDLLGLASVNHSRDHRVEAAMMTVLRSAYFDPRLRDQLSDSLKKDVDTLLDSLTA